MLQIHTKKTAKGSAQAVLTTLFLLCLPAQLSAQDTVPAVRESARGIPVAYETDVVVVGGSTGAVSAAVAAAKTGARVFLAAPQPYLGDDMTATMRVWLEEGEIPASPLLIVLRASKLICRTLCMARMIILDDPPFFPSTL